MKKTTLRRVLEIGGVVSGVVLIAFGIAALWLGFDGRSTVRTNVANEFIVGSSDMTPSEISKEITPIVAAQQKIAAARQKAGADAIEFTPVEAPGCTVADQPVDNGTSARCFAQYMRIHALASSSGLTYSQMGRYAAKTDAPAAETDFNGGTNNPQFAVIDDTSGQPVANGARNLWVTQTALASALNLAYTAEQISMFGVVVGIALLLTGIGLLILAIAVLHSAPVTVEERKEQAAPGVTPTAVS
jgi:uncharacterized iron-regulated membrane protein